MIGTSDEQMKKNLVMQRKPLAERFEKNPQQLHLALEIKAIDDRIAECDQSIRQARKSWVALKK